MAPYQDNDVVRSAASAMARLMELTSGRSDIIVSVIDGPVSTDHPDLATAHLREMREVPAACAASDASCVHGTFVAGVLAARRGSGAPAICPGCTLLLHPIFDGGAADPSSQPHASRRQLADALVASIEHGARIINVSAAVTQPRADDRDLLARALDLAVRRDVLVVAAGGNDATIASSTLTRHPWVISVVASTASGRPTPGATLGPSIGARGLSAPGEDVTSLAPGGGRLRLSGSSAAAPFVTGAAALLWSLVPEASAAEIRIALTAAARPSRRRVVPPVVDAWGAYEHLRATRGR